ncbi:dUTP diphosphatase [Aquipuribacter hungaricus]|uniref:Deoxyuridine 5'-triphosphate nucleotidohydrolase n=1 Tax=Aquipuribacter hungaricus TaxID=545624 RepID=A0ABV7WD72_9MICO
MHPADDVPATRPSSPPADPWDGAVVDVLVRRLADVPLPARARPGDAGLDLVCTEDVELAPGERATVGTGLALALPVGTAAFVLPRSGLAARHGVTVLNAPGTVDAGYRGEVRVTLLNTSTTTPVRLSAGDRVAQLVVMELPAVHLVEVDRLPGSGRGEGGFGSTGTAAVTTSPAGPAGSAGPAHPDLGGLLQ